MSLLSSVLVIFHFKHKSVSVVAVRSGDLLQINAFSLLCFVLGKVIWLFADFWWSLLWVTVHWDMRNWWWHVCHWSPKGKMLWLAVFALLKMHVYVSAQEPHRVYPSIPAHQRRPIKVLSLFDGIATGWFISLCVIFDILSSTQHSRRACGGLCQADTHMRSV